MPRAIGIDVGGTKIAGGLVDLNNGLVRSRRLQPTNPARGGQAILDDVFAMAKSLQSDSSWIGIGIAELVDCNGNIASNATIDWLNLSVREHLGALLPTRIEADVRAAARAEARYGAGHGSKCFLYVTVGTGISSCLVIDEKPFRGARGFTGTFASAPTLSPDQNGQIISGQPLESFSSGPALANRYQVQTGKSLETPAIAQLADAGDPVAQEILESGGRCLGAAIAQLVNTLDPEWIVVGGGLGCADGCFHSALKKSIRDHVWSRFHQEIPIYPAKLGPDAGIIGAALAAAGP